MLGGSNMLVHPLSRMDEHIEDEHVSHVQFLQFLLTDTPFMDEARHTFLIHHHIDIYICIIGLLLFDNKYNKVSKNSTELRSF